MSHDRGRRTKKIIWCFQLPTALNQAIYVPSGPMIGMKPIKLKSSFN